MAITTTLRKLKDADACVPRYKHLCEGLGRGFGKTATLPLTKILETNGREDVLWALFNAADGGDKIVRLWAADCAEHVQHIWLKSYPNDARPADAIKAARAFARGEITTADGTAAGAAARAAARAAAWAAARAAAGTAAGTAEEQWQTGRLIEYLNEEVTEDWHAEVKSCR